MMIERKDEIEIKKAEEINSLKGRRRRKNVSRDRKKDNIRLYSSDAAVVIVILYTLGQNVPEKNKV